jgi:peptidoglycan/xylan/chitin deacetylase (PgdA/CDA1 family)
LRLHPVLLRLTAASVLVLGLIVLSGSKADAAELVPNPSMESGTTTPTSWNNNTSGVNTSSFTWSTNGHTGSRSLRTNVTAFTSGDAKWWFDPVAVSPNTTYTYSYWSRSTVDSQLLVEFGNGTSNVSVVWLATMPASPGVWTQRTKTFMTLADTVTVTMYHALETVGVSEIDDASLPSVAAPTPTVTVTVPAAGAVVSGFAVALGATTTGTGILGVQFKVDGANVGAEDTTSPYGVTWNSTAVADGSHAVTATLRTAATSITSAAVTVTVTNSTPGQLVANPSMELGTTTPTSWSTGVFGVNTSTFTWSTNGHTGSRSLRTDVTALTSGDAKWYFAPVTVSPSTSYTYSYWTRSTVVTQILAEYTNAAGVSTVVWLEDVPVSAGVWTQRNKTLTTPADAVKLTIYHAIPVVGSLETDDVSLTVSTSAPTIAVTAPTGGATVSGTAVTLSASTTGTGLLGVQFKVDGVSVGAEDTTSPYSITWNSTTVANGTRGVTAVLRTATTTVTSAVVGINVNNTELLTNGTLELANGSQPASWANASFGVLTSSFSYPATGGHSGTRFVRTDVAAFTNGDAKWYPTSTVAVTAGSYYRFSDWYRTNTQTEVLAEVTLSGGATTYMVGSLPLPSASAWTQYKTTWKMPPNATALRVWHSVVAVGFLETDDYSLMLQSNAPLTRPLISITVDDGNSSDINYFLPKLQTTSMPATFFVVSSYLGSPNHTTAAQVVQLKNAGMEIGAHTVTHPDLATLSVAAQQAEIVNSKTALQNVIGVPIVSFAAPYGHYTSQTLDIIRANFTYHRSTGQNLNYRPTTNLYEIRERQIDPSTTATQVSQWISDAVASNAWLVFMFHDVSTTPTATGTTPTVFDQMMNTIKNSGVTVKTMKDAAAEVAPQLLP